MASLLRKARDSWEIRQAARRASNDPHMTLPPNVISMRRGYDGAASGRRVANWLTSSTGPNTELLSSLPKLRNRHRDLVRNNAWAARAVQAITNNTVGAGILPSSKNKRLMKLWKKWGETTACDADGRLNFYGLQSLWMRAVVESGEVFIRRRWRSLNKGLPVPLQLQTLEADFLDATKTESLADGGYILQGIQFNAIGERTGYWMYPSHPGEKDGRGLSVVSKFVPAEEIIHIYRVDRPGQIRGVPWGAPAIIRLRDIDETLDTYLIRQKLAACFVVFLYDTAIPDDVDGEYELLDKIEPGAVQILPPGKRAEFANPPGVDGLKDIFKLNLEYVATGYGMPYYMLTGNLTDVNFSSGRMGANDFGINVDSWQWNMLIPHGCNATWKWFAKAAEFVGAKYDDSEPEWTPPARIIVDLKNEIPIVIDMIRAGLMSLPEGIRKLGFSPETVLEEIKDTNDLLDKLELILDSDPRQGKKPAKSATNKTANEDATTAAT